MIPEDVGREFKIGKKIFTLQRNLCDNGWDVELPGAGWHCTGFPVEYSASQAEEAFRLNFKGGARRWLAKRDLRRYS